MHTLNHQSDFFQILAFWGNVDWKKILGKEVPLNPGGSKGPTFLSASTFFFSEGFSSASDDSLSELDFFFTIFPFFFETFSSSDSAFLVYRFEIITIE